MDEKGTRESRIKNDCHERSIRSTSERLHVAVEVSFETPEREHVVLGIGGKEFCHLLSLVGKVELRA